MTPAQLLALWDAEHPAAPEQTPEEARRNLMELMRTPVGG